MEAVQIRRRGSKDFVAYYESLCALEGTCPVASVRAGAKEGVLNCHVRRLKRDDWHPLLTALRINRALHTVVFYCKWEERVLPILKQLDDARKLRKASSYPSPQSSVDTETLHNIARSVQECLCVSGALKSLVFEGILLKWKDCKCLAKGLVKNSSLTHISLKGSGVGDKAVEVLCRAVKSSHSLEWLDLTACNLTSQGAVSIASLIKHHCLCRQSDAWKDSLRFRQPNLGQASGLRRVTLNLNPDIGDRGAREFADTLKDDVCLRALDLQSCGVSTEGASCLQEVLRVNTTLIVLDLRANPLIDDDLLDATYEQLAINVAGMDKSTESYVWLEVEAERIAHELAHSRAPPSRRHPATTRLRTHIRPGHAVAKGVPWRAAARSTQRWKSLAGRSASSFKSPAVQFQTEGLQLVLETPTTSASVCSTEDHSSGTKHAKVEATMLSQKRSDVVTMSAQEFKQLQVELTICHRKLKEESYARTRADSQVLKLEVENRALKEQLKVIKSQQVLGFSDQCLTQDSDEHLLQVMETTIKQFNAFLDLLHSRGLEEACKIDDPFSFHEPRI